MPLDPVDARIVALLAQNGRRSFQSIARELAIPRRLVRNRIQQLTDSRRVKICAVVHPRARGFESAAAFCLNVDISRLEEATSSLAAFQEIGWVTMVSGRYDILCGGYFRDDEHISRFVVDKLSKLQSVTRLETFHFLRVIKTSPEHFIIPRPSDGRNTGSFQLDPIDLAIVTGLGQNAQKTNTEIARSLGMSEGAVRHRIRRLEERGLIMFAAIVDPRALGHEIDGSFWMRIELASLLEAANRLAGFPQVHFVGITLGRFSLLCRAYFDTKIDLVDFATQELPNIPGIQEIEMFHTLRRVKRTYVPLDEAPVVETGVGENLRPHLAESSIGR